MTKPNSVVLGLDVGGVICQMGLNHDGSDIYKNVDPDFTSFAMLYSQWHGLDALHVISRTKNGKWNSHRGKEVIEHYCVRVVRAAGLFKLGMSEDHCHLTKFKSGPEGKGPIAEACRLTIFVDNDWENLVAVATEPSGNAAATLKHLVYYDNGGQIGQLPRNVNFGANVTVHKVISWKSISKICGLPDLSDDIWWSMRMLTPPCCKFRTSTALMRIVDDISRRREDDGKQRQLAEASKRSRRRPTPPRQPPPPNLPSGLRSHAPFPSAPTPDAYSTRKSTAASSSLVDVVSDDDEKAEDVPASAAVAASAAASPSAASADAVAASANSVAASISSSLSATLIATAIQEAVAKGVSDALASDSVRRRLLQSNWYDRKRRRAEAHQTDTGAAPPPRTSPMLLMCAHCDKGQPGSYCVRQMCRPCCQRMTTASSAAGGDGRTCQQPQHQVSGVI